MKLRISQKKSENAKVELIRSYETISKEYIRLKKRPWKEFVNYLEKIKNSFPLPKRGLVVDIGAGNARNLQCFLRDTEQYWEGVAVDISLELLGGITGGSNFYPHRINGDMVYLPIRDETAEMVICIASIHHLKTHEELEISLKDMERILKKEGYIILSCWRRWKADTRKEMIRDLILFPFKKIINREWRHGDYYLPWHDKEGRIIARRYYHLFTKSELKRAIQKTGLKICDIDVRGGKNGRDNFFVLMKKEK